MRKVQLIVDDKVLLYKDYENITPLMEDIDKELSKFEWKDAITISANDIEKT